MKRSLIIFIFLLLVTSFLRLYKLTSIPQGFHADEAAFGYNAYSLLQTGKDEYGQKLPLVLKSFGDYKGAIYSYITVPFIAVLGLNELSVRLPTAVFGILIVVLSFFIVKTLSGDTTVSLLVAAIVSFEPSSILLSRVQSDPLISVALVYVGLLLFVLYVQSGRLLYLGSTILPFVVSFYTYASPRVLVFTLIPLLLTLVKKRTTQSLLPIGVLFIVCFVCLLFTFGGSAGTRLTQVNFFGSQDVVLPLEEKIREDGVQSSALLETRFLHNKPVEYFRAIALNYAHYIGFDFLYFQSEQPERERIPSSGVFHLIEILFFFAGVYAIVRRGKPWQWFFLLWYFAIPIPLAFFNQETPNIHRFYMAVLPHGVVVVSGLFWALSKVKAYRVYYPFAALAVCAYVISVWSFTHQLFVHQPIHFPQYRGHVYKELMSKLIMHRQKYERIVITKAHQSPYIYYLFYSKFSPSLYQSLGSPRDLDYMGFDTLVFVPEDCPSNLVFQDTAFSVNQVGTLFVNKSGCELEESDMRIDVVKWRDGTPAFELVEKF